ALPISVDGGDDRHRQPLDPPEIAFRAFDIVEEILGRVGGIEDGVEIGAGKKRILRRGENNALEARLRFKTLKRLAHIAVIGIAHRVGGLARHVHRDRDNAVCIFFINKSGHFASPYTRSMMEAMPMPPPTHMQMSARFSLRRPSSSSIVETRPPRSA